MRTIEEQRVALDCVALALSNGRDLTDAEAFYAFVTGERQDDAKLKLDAVDAAFRT
ncbi:hypothetical protein [Novosphingobium fuchskuhlense]|uniref:hypothetical protein n=1 Tax=Novosphingobium fuchskuhlense TaxID=1117702 RepID=UPI000A5B96F9|nr:hypothetical protein [Novosphingobium fuchskuhlense]